MEEMMARQATLPAQILASPEAAAVAGAARDAELVTVSGCGTSEHAAWGVAALLAAAIGPARVRALPALTAALAPAPGLCIGVSHDGGTRATRLALDAARAAGARTAVITAKPGGDVPAAADLIVTTPVGDRGWCHTVGYTSPLLAGAAIAAELGLEAVEPDAAAELLRAAARGPEAAAIAAALAGRRVILCAGAGADHVTARELGLKIAEGARLATAGFELETVLHGQLAGHDAADGLVLVAWADDERVARRAGLAATAVRELGLPVAALLSPVQAARIADELTPAGRLVTDAGGGLEPTLAALLGGAAALQAVTLELAHARGVNPDLIRREEEPYRRAAAAAESAGDW
jgi:fructoselysine-6-P-deglycase FrlB-like protein